MYTESEVLDYVKEEDVKFIRLAFFDLHGIQKNISITANKLPDAFRNGISFDASAVDGFESPDKSDLFLHPEASTITVIPWRPSTGKVVRMFCSIKYPDGTEYEKDCRQFLKNAVKKAEELCSLEFLFGSENEFYLFKLDEKERPSKIPFDNGTYMDISPRDRGENIRREICFTLEQMGITPESSHHEEGPGQNKIDFNYSDALSAADNTTTFKWIVRTRAAASGLYADFSPKPLADKAGSGMHINISCRPLFKKNNIEDSDEKTNSYVLGGIMKHIEEMTYFLNPSEDSYLRLGEKKASRAVTVGRGNRSTCVRIPDGKNFRIEIRTSDSMCNPYLAFGLLIHAAIDGIQNKIEPPPFTEEDLGTDTKNIASKFRMLPDSLKAARKIAEESGFINSVMRDFL